MRKISTIAGLINICKSRLNLRLNNRSSPTIKQLSLVNCEVRWRRSFWNLSFLTTCPGLNRLSSCVYFKENVSIVYSLQSTVTTDSLHCKTLIIMSAPPRPALAHVVFSGLQLKVPVTFLRLLLDSSVSWSYRVSILKQKWDEKRMTGCQYLTGEGGWEPACSCRVS